ncbi:dihydrolipoyl dehydrogenase [Halomonas sp. HP20-15]|uniref:dihydrolipoyl dehydrogenase family protein n=1 Tax=Halomonas sp. HP20-15 TaxID=3085901 RepID=UPI0029812A12|nr:dihydrolipoyl dehydrogenase [Halomonas sp. HP20-15]MDW5377886.1 dihydrolipoyl dehydrogenase [Halomonas sp. HP20-15]
MTRHFDVVVIGGGSGLTAASQAVDDGRSVALVTDRPEAMGGTCVNFGCIPTKTLIQAAEVMTTIRNAERFGIHLDQGSVRADFAWIMASMRQARADNASDPRRRVEATMTPVYSRVRFVGERCLETAEGERISGDSIFIATGARASVPPIEGLEACGYLTSETALELERQPDSLVIVGGGYIGAEMGHFFASLGTRVTLINGSARLLSEDEEVGALFTEVFSEKVERVTGRAVRASRRGEARQVEVEDQSGKMRTVVAEQILLAAGRQPNTESLALAATGVECDEKGAIRVDERLATTCPGIYAYGDVIGRAMFKHTASYEGQLAYRNSRGANEAVSYRSNPHAVFSDPQIAAVGLTEQACREQGLDYRALRKDYADSAKGKIIGAPRGFAKLLIERHTDRILGFHIIGPDAATLIHEVIVAMNAGDGTAESVRRTIHVHPSLPELIHSLFNASGER